MDWKETVMSQDEFEEWCGSHQIKGCGKTRTMCKDYCRPLAQAEITGDIAYKAGIREVVGFVNMFELIDEDCKDEWQAKLKEWGLTNE
ncbi:hypothetical protein LCGC14_2954830 [marine sediment metagenome]|uniref:Uncharacterized protein n=1 Tax=marine sediment metagenome TaxID=412755 RepID=A0A0F8Y1E6_9ZZZZ